MIPMYLLNQFIIQFKSRISSVANMSRKAPNPEKTAVRELITARLATLSQEDMKRQSKIVYNKVINHPFYKDAKRVSFFLTMHREVDIMPVIEHHKARGGIAFVPQYAGGKMRMLRLQDNDENKMPLTRHGIRQHSKDMDREDALEEGLDLIVAPGAAFSRDMGRVGHGGGYYDKYIAHLRTNPETAPKVLAVAFKCQVLDEVPMDEHDQRLDALVYPEDDEE